MTVSRAHAVPPARYPVEHRPATTRERRNAVLMAPIARFVPIAYQMGAVHLDSVHAEIHIAIIPKPMFAAKALGEYGHVS